MGSTFKNVSIDIYNNPVGEKNKEDYYYSRCTDVEAKAQRS